VFDADTIGELRTQISNCVLDDRALLDELLEEIRPLETTQLRIQPRSTTSISMVGTDGGNNELRFDPFLIQIIRIVDSSNNQLWLEVVTPTTPVTELDARHLRGSVACSPLGRMMVALGVKSVADLAPAIHDRTDRPRSPSWTNVYREIIEWAVLLELLQKDYGSDTLFVFDGYLRSKVFKGALFMHYGRLLEAAKPNYAVEYWRRNGHRPPKVDVLKIITLRASRYYRNTPARVDHSITRGDSRQVSHMSSVCGDRKAKFIITSPPYYGLRTYVSDQWLRGWFLGGADHVDYSYGTQLSHRGLNSFVSDLRRVWINVAKVSRRDARLIFRFGAINDRSVDPRDIIGSSLEDTPWRLSTLIDAGNARLGKRQADSFGGLPAKPISEYDAWAVRA
jgi:hypothetical protein